jgi:hypothetical protein
MLHELVLPLLLASTVAAQQSDGSGNVATADYELTPLDDGGVASGACILDTARMSQMVL